MLFDKPELSSSTNLDPEDLASGALPPVDVLVIGGGPAGTACALTLKKYSNLSVAVVESSGYERWRVGETLSPGIVPLLQYLGIWDAFLDQKHKPSYGTAAAWGTNHLLPQDFLYTPQGQGWHIDRVRFDSWLAALAAERGTCLYLHTRARSFTRQQDGFWSVTLRQDNPGKPCSLNARFLVDASGAGAIAARRLGARRLVSDRLTGIAGLFQLPSQNMTQEALTIVEATADGWWYQTSVPDNRIIVTFMTDPDVIRTKKLYARGVWSECVYSTTHLAGRLAGAILIEGPHVRCAYSQALDRFADEGWIATGEAAVCFDPLSAMGIGYAVLSGIEAARAVHAVLGGRAEALTTYGDAIVRHYCRYREQQRLYYQSERRWPGVPFWRRRQTAPLPRCPIAS